MTPASCAPLFRSLRALLPLALLGGGIAMPLRGQAATPPPEVARARALLAEGKADSAIALLEPVLVRVPAAAAARMLLGDAYRHRGALDQALATYAEVRAPRPLRLTALFRSAAIEAGRGRADAAFAFLQQLRGSGAFDMDRVIESDEFAALRRDVRFDSLPFRPEEFTRPFVEPVRIIHEWAGETKGDQFSWIARSIGDVDGDQVNDLVTSAPTFGRDSTGAARGRVYVYSGRSGRLLWTHTGAPGAQLGTGLEGTGDVNGDRANDVVAGAPGINRALVLSGRDGRLLHTLAGDSTNEAFGSSAAGAGDQDGDGVADVIVGAPASNAAGQGAGRAYLFSGRTGAKILALDGERAGDAFGSIVAGQRNGRGTPILVGAPGAGVRRTGRVYAFGADRSAPKFVIESDSSGTALGQMFTSLVGDVDRDGVPDIYAADFSNAALGPSTGRIYVHSGADGRRLYTLTGERAGDGYGIGSADVGDVDGDGYDDLLVGAWQYSAAAPSGGKIYLHSGRDGRVLRSITGRIPGETLGFDATGIGDVDGDGTIDFLVTSSWSNIKGFQSGRMFVISGR